MRLEWRFAWFDNARLGDPLTQPRPRERIDIMAGSCSKATQEALRDGRLHRAIVKVD